MLNLMMKQLSVMLLNWNLTKSDHSKVQDLLHEFKDVFPDELPAELTPERSVSFHFTQFL